MTYRVASTIDHGFLERLLFTPSLWQRFKSIPCQ